MAGPGRTSRVLADWLRHGRMFALLRPTADFRALVHPVAARPNRRRASEAGLMAPVTLPGRRDALMRLYRAYRVLLSLATACLLVAAGLVVARWILSFAQIRAMPGPLRATGVLA